MGLLLMTLDIFLPPEALVSANRFYSTPHWSKRAALAEAVHEQVWGAVLAKLGVPIDPFPVPVVVTMTAWAVRPMDPDAYAKTILDGLVNANVLKDDSYQHIVELRLRSRKADKRHPPGVLVEIEEAT